MNTGKTKNTDYKKNAVVFLAAVFGIIFLLSPGFSPTGTFYTSQVTYGGAVTEFDYVKDSLGRDHLVYVNGTYVYYQGPYGTGILVNSGSSPAIAVGPDGKPQIVLYHLGYVQYATLGENGNFDVSNVEVGSSPDIAVDGDNKAHVVFFKDYHSDGYPDILYFSNTGGSFAYVKEWNGWYYYESGTRQGGYYNQGGVPSIEFSTSEGIIVSYHYKWIYGYGIYNGWGTQIHVWRSSDDIEIGTEDWYHGTYSISRNSLTTSPTANFVTFNGPSGIQFAEVSGTWTENVLGSGSSPSLAVSAESTPAFAFVDGSDVKYSEVSTEVIPVSVAGPTFVTTTVDSGTSPILAETANGAFIYYLKSGQVWKATDADSTEPFSLGTGVSPSYFDGEETTWVLGNAKAYAGFEELESGISSCEYTAFGTTWSSATWNETTGACQSQVDLAEQMKFKATNGAGLANESEWIYYEIDSQAPSFGSFILPQSGSLYRDGDAITAIIPVSDSDSGISGCSYYLMDGGSIVQNGSLDYSEGNCTGTFTLDSSGSSGRFELRIYSFDNVGNNGYSEVGVNVDNFAPYISYAGISSNNLNNNGLAKPGDNVTLRVIPSETLGAFSAEIAGKDAHTWSQTETISETTQIGPETATVYYATVQMEKGDWEGQVSFEIEYSDLAGNEAEPASKTTDDSYVIFDETAPSFSTLRIWSNRNWDNTSFARVDDYSYVAAYGASEDVSLKTFTIEGREAGDVGEETVAIEPDFEGYTQMVWTDPTGHVYFELTVSDNAGNVATFTEKNTTDGSFVYLDNRPDRVYVSKDYCNTYEVFASDIAHCENDGRTWGYDAFSSIQDGVDGVYDSGYVYVMDSEYYDEAVELSRPVSIYGSNSIEPVSIQQIEEEEGETTSVYSFELDSDGIYISSVDVPLVIVTQKGSIQAGVNFVSENGEVKLKLGTWNEYVDINKPLTLNGTVLEMREEPIELSDLQEFTDKSIIKSPSENSYGIYISSNDVTIKNLNIEKYRPYGTTISYGNAIYMYGNNLTVENVKISGYTAGIYVYSYAYNNFGLSASPYVQSEITSTVRVKDSTIEGERTYVSCNVGDVVEIPDCYTYTTEGIAIDTDYANLEVSGTEISGFDYGAYSEYADSMSVFDSGFEGIGCENGEYNDDSVSSQGAISYCSESGRGIYANYFKSLKVNSTNITDFNRGVYFYSESCGDGGEGIPTSLESSEEDVSCVKSSVEILDSILATQSGSTSYDRYGLEIYSDNLGVYDSSVEGFKYGIYSSYGENTLARVNATFDRNLMYDCYNTYGIRTYGKSSILSGIRTEGYTYAIQVNGETVLVEDFNLFGKDNYAEDGCYPGVGIYSYASESSTIRNGEISNFNYGIDLQGSGCNSLDADSVEAGDVSAQRPESDDSENSKATVENVRIVGGEWEDYYYDSVSSQITEIPEYPEYQSETGIHSNDQNNLTVTACTVEKFVHGMAFYNGKNLNVYGNTVRNNGGRNSERSGIDLYSVSSGRVHNNDIYSNNVGVYSENSKAAVEFNRITENYEYDGFAEGKAANMTRNWWGTASFEEILGLVSGKVDFSFWCLDETCTTFAEPIVLSEENSTLLGLSDRYVSSIGYGNFIGTISGDWYSDSIGFRFASDGNFYKVSSNGIYTISEETGEETFLRNLVPPVNYYDAYIYALAVDPLDGTVYVSLHTHESRWWCRDKFGILDLETGTLTYLGDTNVGYYGGYQTLAADSEGNLYGAVANNLYLVDKSTGTGTFVSTIGTSGEIGSLNGYSTYFYTYGMDFAPDGTLYASGYRYDNGQWGIYTIDKTNGYSTWVSYTGTDNGYVGSSCYELAFSPEGKLYCYNYGGDGPSLVQVKLTEGKVATFQYALGYGKSFGYPLDGLGMAYSDSEEEIDFGLLRSWTFSPAGLSAGFSTFGSIAWGVEGRTIAFDPEMQISIWVGEGNNGKTLSVLRSVSPIEGWTTDGLASSTCFVSGGYCTFMTEKASYFVAGEFAAEKQSSSGGSGYVPTCRPGFELSSPENAQATGDFVEVPVTLKVTGTCTDFGADIIGEAPAGWRIDVGETGRLMPGEEETLTATILVPTEAEGTVRFKVRIGGVDYTAETLVKGAPKQTQSQPEPEEGQEETTTTVAPETTTTVGQGPSPPTGFFTGLFTAFQNLWNWMFGWL